MSVCAPPEKLPKPFLEIWTLLATEENSAGSRQKLAKKLRISTGTLQKILVSGDIPDFYSIKNNRILNAWSRTVTRIARYFNRDPEPWIATAGLPVTGGSVETDQIRKIPVENKKMQETLHRGLSPASIIPFLERIGVADFDPFSLPLPGLRYSFPQEFMQRLAGSIVPHIRIRFQSLDSLDMLKELSKPEPYFFLGVAALITSARMTGGIEFLEIPGWRIQINAIQMVSPGQRVGRFWDAIDPDSVAGPLFIVTAGAVTHTYLSGQCCISDEQILVRTPQACADPVSLLIHETHRHPGRTVIMMAAETQCYRMKTAMANREDNQGFQIETLEHGPGEFPSYPVGIAFHPKAAHLIPIMKNALELELFGTGSLITARLYAALIAADIRRNIQENRKDAGFRRFAHLENFQLAGPPFHNALQQAVKHHLEDLLHDQTPGDLQIFE